MGMNQKKKSKWPTQKKISFSTLPKTKQFLPKFGLIFMGMKQKKNIFLKKKIKMANSTAKLGMTKSRAFLTNCW